MPDITTVDSPAPAPAATAEVAGSAASRRSFLVGTSAVALAATAGAGATLAFPGRRSDGAVDPDAAAEALTDPRTVVAYVRQGETEVTVMSGDREVVVDDPALARLLLGKVG